jgi:membrane-bound metal-dependent hydrolase YbcI (DUF457 family)
MTRRRRIRALADPFLHAGFAAAVLAPTVRRAGWGPLRAGIAAGLIIDLDHVVAARSVRVAKTAGMPTRPRPHNLFLATAASAAAWRTAGRKYGWAVFAGLWSHLLFDATDGSGAPLFWPVARRDRVPIVLFLVALAALAAGSTARAIIDEDLTP